MGTCTHTFMFCKLVGERSRIGVLVIRDLARLSSHSHQAGRGERTLEIHRGINMDIPVPAYLLVIGTGTVILVILITFMMVSIFTLLKDEVRTMQYKALCHNTNFFFKSARMD